MQRLALQQLKEWQRLSLRKPLILQGARQTGKTYLITEFAKQTYENLNLYHGTSIKPEKTLIIFDEIQVSQRAITSLKYFNEKANQYHIIAAGSLLGVSIVQSGSFSVGKVDFMNLYPLNFLEYLIALGESGLADLLINKKDFSPLAEPIHEKLTNFFRTFLFIGGMPEVVSNYIERKDIELAQKIQSLIIQSYNNDFSKYAEPNESIRISNVWQSIPFQLAKENKKFTLADIESGARLSRYELALEWLRKAGLIYIAYNTTIGKLPIKSYINPKKFKLYYLDTGLLTARLKAPPEIAAVVDNLYTEFKGALIENYVAKELFPQFDEYLYYWSSKSQAEVDFVVEHRGQVFPIEVKSGMSRHKKSLTSFNEKYEPALMVRFSPRNFKQDNNFVNVPVYAASILKNLLQ